MPGNGKAMHAARQTGARLQRRRKVVRTIGLVMMAGGLLAVLTGAAVASSGLLGIMGLGVLLVGAIMFVVGLDTGFE